MASTYITDPPPTASITLHTTAGPIPISLFASQTPLTCRNFLQHILDATYTNNLFHRISPGFLIQTGDPTGTGAGGESIYEDRDFETYDAPWARLLGREEGEKIVFKDEVHSRLKFNRRGMVGMAKADTGDGKGGPGGYGSQFFITLGDCRAELDGKCTLFGRVEAEGIYNVLKIAEGEVLEGTERPVFPERILRVEVGEMPKGEVWEGLKARRKIAERVEVEEKEGRKDKVAKKGKKAKVLLSFGDEEDGEMGENVVKAKRKFNTNLIDGSVEEQRNGAGVRGEKAKSQPRKPRSPSPAVVPQKRKISPSPPCRPDPTAKPDEAQPQPHRRRPSFHDPITQLPLLDPESPSQSPSPPPATYPNSTSLATEIAALKASMRRTTTTAPAPTQKKSALESLIPATSTRGRKRPRPGHEGNSTKEEDKKSLEMLEQFRRRLERIEQPGGLRGFEGQDDRDEVRNGHDDDAGREGVDGRGGGEGGEEGEEAVLCDLHFIANCQSCSRWDHDLTANTDNTDLRDRDDENDKGWLNHTLKFEKDRLGKDLAWREKNNNREVDDGGLVVIDHREKERELGIKPRKGESGRDWERRREKERRTGRGR